MTVFFLFTSRDIFWIILDISFPYILIFEGFQHQKCAVSGFQAKRLGHWWTA